MKVVEVAAVARPAEGQHVCGDSHLVLDRAGMTLIAVADGLGHGPHAAEAAQAFCSYVQSNVDLPLDEMMRGAHKALLGSRGVAGALLRFVANTRTELEFVGVGNIEVRTQAAAIIKPVSQPGVVGARMRRVLVQRFPLTPNDLVVAFSDGLSHRVEIDGRAHLAPAMLAAELLSAYGHSHDDATCVVARAV